ncbi:DUF3078 domain-containing protein [Cytophagaceae bacterium ABcell3]|nr:DUF3078 domain-containing protein [Cytophagaceae bacterium ABcell3]
MNKYHSLVLVLLIVLSSIPSYGQEDILPDLPDPVEPATPPSPSSPGIEIPEPPTGEDTVKYWHFGGNSSLTFAQVGLRNWIGGGQSSIALNTIQTLFLNYERERFMWNNNLELGFGLIRQGQGEERTGLRKSDDRLIFISKFSRRATGNWMFTGLLDFRTQMAAGYNYAMVDGQETRTMISDFLAPGFIITSLGWEYRRSQNFFVVLAPVTTKQTLVIHDRFAEEGRFGVDPGQNFRIEYGALFNARFKREIFENVTVDTRINLFGNYQNITSIDVNWEFLLLMKINEYLAASFSTHLLYDDDIDIPREDGTVGPATQLRTVLNIGLTYKFDRN